MEIIKKQNGTELTIALQGSLDSVTSTALEAAVENIFDGLTKLIFDFKELDYISSAGLRVLLRCYKSMSTHGSMVIINVNSEVLDIFEVTGFTNILTIE